jgi:hypothetical protein
MLNMRIIEKHEVQHMTISPPSSLSSLINNNTTFLSLIFLLLVS